MNSSFDFTDFLREALAAFDCQTGTIHRTSGDGRTLELVAYEGVPEFLLEKIGRIPFGKGIAGVAAETRAPVELCNLQQDLGSVAKAGARATGVSGSLAVPVFAKNGAVIGTLGVGMQSPHDFSEAEKERLAEFAVRLAPQLDSSASEKPGPADD